MSNDETAILSASECQTIVHRYYGNRDHKLLDYVVNPLGGGIAGFMGEHFWLTARAKRNNTEEQLKFFAKVQPMQYELMHAFSNSTGAFENEIFFYETLVPEFRKYHRTFDTSILPKFLFSRRDSVVVMEDCGQSNFVLAESDDVLSLDHIKLVLRAFAKLHATSLVYEETRSALLGREYRMWQEYAKYLQEKFFRDDPSFLGYSWHVASVKCVRAIIDRMPEVELARDDFKRKFEELAQQCFTVAKPATQFRNVCCHGDLWRKNVLFKYEHGVPVACKLIDFQLMKYHPPVYDVLKFLHQVTSSETRQHHLDEIMRLYYEALSVELKSAGIEISSVIPMDQYRASIKYIMPYTKVEGLYYYTFQRAGMDFMAKVMADKEAFKTYTFVDRSSIVPELYHEGTYFKDWIDQILTEIRDIIVKDGFSREDCHTTLRNRLHTTDYKLVKYELSSLEELSGFMGYHKKMLAIVERKGKQEVLQFFAKFLPVTEFKEFAIASGVFDSEVFMYKTVFPMMVSAGITDIHDCVPQCYFTRRNDVLVFEDLTESGYTTLNKFKAFDYDHARVAVSTLARLHASCLLLEEKLSQPGEPFRIADRFAEDLKEPIYLDTEGHIGLGPVQACIKGCHTQIDLFPDPESTITDAEFKRKVAKIYGQLMYEYSKPSAKYRNVICHGDLWSSNMLVKYEDGKPQHVKLVDFQGVKKCPPAQDLMTLIFLTTSRKFRANFLTEIIDVYHREFAKTLARHGHEVESLLPYREFRESCEHFKTFATAQCVFHFQFIMASAEDMADLFQDDSLCRSSFYVDRSEFITKMCAKNSRYKFMMGECLKDLRILCENLDV